MYPISFFYQEEFTWSQWFQYQNECHLSRQKKNPSINSVSQPGSYSIVGSLHDYVVDSPLFMGTICPGCELDRQGEDTHIQYGSCKACDHSTYSGRENLTSRQVWPGPLDFAWHRILWTLVRCKIFIWWPLVSRATLFPWSLLTWKKYGFRSAAHYQQFLRHSLNRVYYY